MSARSNSSASPCHNCAPSSAHGVRCTHNPSQARARASSDANVLRTARTHNHIQYDDSGTTGATEPKPDGHPLIMEHFQKATPWHPAFSNNRTQQANLVDYTLHLLSVFARHEACMQPVHLQYLASTCCHLVVQHTRHKYACTSHVRPTEPGCCYPLRCKLAWRQADAVAQQRLSHVTLSELLASTQ
jgi:hypothetical protein